jgi:ethanolamine utilization protein EutN
MELGKIIGTVVATRKDSSLEGLKLLLLQPLDERLNPRGEPLVSVDTVRAGRGSIVLWVRSREASIALPRPHSPVDAAVVGIVDSVNL